MKKRLSDILYTVKLREIKGSTQIDIAQLCLDSRTVTERSLFIAQKGTQTDGHAFIGKSIENGATAIVCETMPATLIEGITYIKVADSTEALYIIANNFYNHPSKKMNVIGVTGTNGKTTTVSLLFRLFRKMQYNVGLISTIQYQINEQVKISTHTTPNPIALNALMAEMVDQGCEYCFMEVSSHALVQKRVQGIHFVGGIFTNITHDHLDYHGTFKAYIAAKKMFFDFLPPTAFALTNLDDKRANVMVQNTKANIYTYALKTQADFKAKILENSFEGLVLNVADCEVHSLLIGEFNAYNLLAVYAAATLLTDAPLEVLTVLSTLKTAEGRFDYVSDKQKRVVGIVDYAHTPDALLKVLSTINKIRTRNEQLITIVGCGGDRDKQKRPKMAKVACELSNQVILTSDNPRSEVPATIIEDMEKGIPPNKVKQTLSIVNRKEAIQTACSMAGGGDIILLAGKGHEKYQEINGVKHPFDDKAILQEMLNKYFG